MPKLSKEGVERFLQEETLFHEVSRASIERLGELAVQKLVTRDTSFFSMGQSCDSLHLVAEGTGSLVRTAPDGRQRILHRAHPGDLVGAVPFFDGKDYPATFVAESDCLILSFPREKLLALFQSDPDVALAILGGLVGRLRMMTALVEQMSFEDVEHRLWEYLVKASTDSGGPAFPRSLDPLPPRERIAQTIGTVREVVSRRLSKLTDSGHVRLDGRRLTLLKPLA